MTKEDTITLVRSDSKTFRLEINKDLIGVGKDYIILELSEDALMQLGKLAMDITNSEGIKQLTLTL